MYLTKKRTCYTRNQQVRYQMYYIKHKFPYRAKRRCNRKRQCAPDGHHRSHREGTLLKDWRGC